MKKTLIALSVVIGLAAIWVMYRTHERPDFTRSTETRRVDSYHVVASKDHKYVIEHRGHRITAKCRKSVTWLNDPNGPGSPLDEHDCTYMVGMVGKTIGEDLMKQEGNALVYYPWAGEDTVQTADYLDITDLDGEAVAQTIAQPPPPKHPLIARDYFNELRDADNFNTYADKYVCFRDDEEPAFAVVSTAEDAANGMKNTGNTKGAKLLTKAGGGLFVRTYYKGVASGKTLLYEKVEDGYQIEYNAPIHGRMNYLINWKTGRYRMQEYVLDPSKTVLALEVSGKCELIHSGDTPSVLAETPYAFKHSHDSFQPLLDNSGFQSKTAEKQQKWQKEIDEAPETDFQKTMNDLKVINASDRLLGTKGCSR